MKDRLTPPEKNDEAAEIERAVEDIIVSSIDALEKLGDKTLVLLGRLCADFHGSTKTFQKFLEVTEKQAEKTQKGLTELLKRRSGELFERKGGNS